MGGFAHGVGVDGEGLGVVAGGEGGESADDGAGGDDGECLFEGVAGAFDAGELVGGEHAVGQEDDFGSAAGTGGCGDVENDVVAGVDGECSGGLVEVGDESGGGECEDDAVAGGGGFGEGFDVEVGDFSEVVGGFAWWVWMWTLAEWGLMGAMMKLSPRGWSWSRTWLRSAFWMKNMTSR